MRNLDITTLRSFVAVADSGGVTRAAGFLHLTQSAVSMQLKRLEEMLDLSLLDRSGRTIALTASGEQLLAYARRMVALNDEVISRLTHQAFEGELTLGVPHDVVYPAVPQVLKQFHAAYPRVKIHLEASYTRTLKQQFAKGDCDVIVTTETGVDQGGETLASKPLVWVGAPGGTAWRHRPLQLAFCRRCVFRSHIVTALDAMDIAWEMSVDTESDRTIEAAVSADLAVHAMIEGTQPPYLEIIDHANALPRLPMQHINMYGADEGADEVRQTLVSLLRGAFGGMPSQRLRAV
ncbi:putative HTH-type transcriptional regulator, lysR family [Sulfitobacter noctilucicola]|uniref:DNA-binding transcriptional LysR family regulator n=1 Tax=Sulfitobacter noctilucicola TaxID=1342301 RepID=A0A7W6MAM0_9RHOB|nr:LysR family transcriptional regulator [Sulfitobacter noctilucicola]KIN64319.1 putative HTH-type transcriptional regulator, lysR family [Sulfitobacter noctilucicola]MBB4174516.1 DNA-binding transcriptional LysR family regulator [Sulfitobacter noctilucicola]